MSLPAHRCNQASLSKYNCIMKGMANIANGGALRAKRMQRGRRASAIWPALADEDQRDFEIVYWGMYDSNIDVSYSSEAGDEVRMWICQTFSDGAR